MMRIAVLDDWQRVARDERRLVAAHARAPTCTFFTEPFAGEDDAARAARAVRHRARHARAHAVSAVARGAAAEAAHVRADRARAPALIDIAGMIERGITVCYTDGGPGVRLAPPSSRWA